MLVTEKQAKEKWCPEARVHSSGGPVTGIGINAYVVTATKADGSDPVSTKGRLGHCIGSGCMAWRWHDPQTTIDVKQLGRERRGYCGKTGEAKQ